MESPLSIGSFFIDFKQTSHEALSIVSTTGALGL